MLEGAVSSRRKGCQYKDQLHKGVAPHLRYLTLRQLVYTATYLNPSSTRTYKRQRSDVANHLAYRDVYGWLVCWFRIEWECIVPLREMQTLDSWSFGAIFYALSSGCLAGDRV